MQGQVRTRLTAIAAVVSLFMIGVTKEISAKIELTNDVSVSLSNATSCPPVNQRCQVVVIGAPRLVPDVSTLNQLFIRFDNVTISSVPPDPPSAALRLSLKAYDDAGAAVCSTNRLGLCSPVELFCQLIDENGKPTNLLTADELHRNIPIVGTTGPVEPVPGSSVQCSDIRLLPQGKRLIFTIDADVTADAAPAENDPMTITLSGAGNEVILDKIGDVEGDDKSHPGGALDIPPRSMDLVRALSELGAARGARPGVELDVAGRNRPVGLTHAFTAPGHRIHRARLTLHVTSRDPLRDFVLLDQGVDSLAGDRRRVPLIALCHLRRLELPDQGAPFAITINLRRAPVVFSLPNEDPCRLAPSPLDLTDSLRDGQLNVIIAYGSRVDFSDLSVTLEDH